MFRFLSITFLTCCASVAFSQTKPDDIPILTDSDGEPIVRANSATSFIPDPGKYVISAWVKEDVTEQPASYENSSILLSYGTGAMEEFTPYGAIIDGWQQIQGVFTIPADATIFNITLKANHFNIDCYFDDVRVVPFDGNMKSFVYDPVTQRLMAELDENNYATFYEYDSEGGLVRVKKETENGVYTIQETRSKTVIQN